jgi:hypothetical protein
VRPTPKRQSWILVCLIPFHPNAAKHLHEAWHSAEATVLSPLQNLDLTGPGLKWNPADGFLRQCYNLLAAWVGDYTEHIMIAQVSYSSWPMGDISI